MFRSSRSPLRFATAGENPTHRRGRKSQGRRRQFHLELLESRLVPTLLVDTGNTLGTAFDIGALPGMRTFSETIGDIDVPEQCSGDGDVQTCTPGYHLTDPNDYFKFSVSAPATLGAKLSGLSADADLQLIRDANGNGAVDPGEVLASSTRGGTSDETVLQSLAAGTYFVRVYPYSGSTSYKLTLTAALDSRHGFATEAVARNADGRMELFTIGSDGAVYYKYQVTPNSGWSSWYSLGGFAKQIAVGTNADGRMELFIIGSDGAVYNRWQVAPNSGWSDGWNYLGSPNDDTYEDNDTLATAYDLGQIWYRSRWLVHVNGQVRDDDWYRFDFIPGGNAYVGLDFVHSKGDLDLALYDAAGHLLRSSTGATNSERISLGGLAGGTYYVRDYGMALS